MAKKMTLDELATMVLRAFDRQEKLMDDRFSGIEATQQDHSRILDNHSRILDNHTKKLSDHSASFSKLEGMLRPTIDRVDQHDQRLERIDKQVGLPPIKPTGSWIPYRYHGKK